MRPRRRGRRRWSSSPTAQRPSSAALARPRAGDVVVVAGKGHETTQEVGGPALPFDDRAVVAEVLGGRRPKGTAPGRPGADRCSPSWPSGGVGLRGGHRGHPAAHALAASATEIGQHIREDGPASHSVKAGTPTMGGIAIVGAVVDRLRRGPRRHRGAVLAHRLPGHHHRLPLRAHRLRRRRHQGPPPAEPGAQQAGQVGAQVGVALLFAELARALGPHLDHPVVHPPRHPGLHLGSGAGWCSRSSSSWAPPTPST